MMKLFGGFGPRVFAAYKEAFPLADGYRERVALYQLYPLMVHVNLFGGGYVSQVEGTLARLVWISTARAAPGVSVRAEVRTASDGGCCSPSTGC